MMRTLWDTLTSPGPEPAVIENAEAPASAPKPKPRRTPMQERYDAMVDEMLEAYDVRVHRWRSSTSGCAWVEPGDDGVETRWIESPEPKSPISAAVFLHEIGHHAIGLGAVRPRCLEEYYAWMWAVERMRDYKLNVTERLQKRIDLALRYAVYKARRRGIKHLPEELAAYDGPPAGRANTAKAKTRPKRSTRSAQRPSPAQQRAATPGSAGGRRARSS